MSDYLSNLAAMVVQPGGQIQPRRPGRFEAGLPLVGRLDLTPQEEVKAEAGVDAESGGAPTVQEAGHVLLGRASASPRLVPEPSSNRIRSHRPEAVPLRVGREIPRAEAQPPVGSKRQELTKAESMSLPKSDLGDDSLSTSSRKPVGLDPSGGLPSDRLRSGGGPGGPRSQRNPALPPEQSSMSASQPGQPIRAVAPESTFQSVAPKEPASWALPLETGRQEVEFAAQTLEDESTLSKPPPGPSATPAPGLVKSRLSIEPASRQPVAGSTPHQVETERPVPTVRVTIGRIEIKASPPPAPPSPLRPVRRKPALPLDQYLKRRDGGER